MRGRINPTNHEKLLSGPIGRSLITLAAPIMLANLFQTTYNLIDTFWLGKLGKVAVAAPAIAWPLIFLMISLGLGFTIAGTALVAQNTGARRYEEAHKTAGQLLTLMMISSIVIAVIGVVAARPLMLLMGAGPDLIDAATAYLQVIYCGLPALFGIFVFTALLNAVGDTITPMKLIGASVALNLLLDPLLIFGWGPFPAWGVTGAAVATVISRGIFSIIGIALLFSGKMGLHIRPHHLVLHWKTVKEILRIGAPSSLGQSGTAIGFSVMTGILARFGTAAIGAFGIGNRIISVAIMPVMGLGQATATIVAQNLGADKKQRAEHCAWIAMGTSTAFLVAASIAVYFLRASLIRVFVTDPEVVRLGERMFSLIAMAFPFMGILQVIIGTYQGSGHTMYSMFFSLFRLWGLRIPLVYFLGFTLAMRADGIWWAMILSNLGATLVSIGFFLTRNWKHGVIKDLPTEARTAAK